MTSVCDLEGVMCPLCGTSLVQNVSVGFHYSILDNHKLLCHLPCAEQLEGYRLLYRVRHYASGKPEVRWRYRF